MRLQLTIVGLTLAFGVHSQETPPVPQQDPPPAERSTPAPTSGEPTTPSAELSFKDGFRMRTPDGRDELRLQVSAQLDGRVFSADSVAPSSFDIRRARIDVQGRMNGFLTVRIQAALEGSPYVRNAWVDLRQSDALHLRLGQMKVPFSTSWLTRDNQVNFPERATSTPIYPFLDQGVMVWGDLARQRLSYQLGLYNGAGVDADTGKSDIDDHKDVVLRLFAQPWRRSPNDAAQGLFVAVNGTHGSGSVPTTRFETRGLTSPNYESLIWRWRTEQVLGTDGRSTDRVTAEIAARSRWGAELHWLHGPLAASLEWMVVSYDSVDTFHDFWVGSNRVLREPVATADGDIESLSGWVSLFLTGERKAVDAFGWRQPEPIEPWAPGRGGTGAWELLGRFSVTSSDPLLFGTTGVDGFDGDDLSATGHAPVAAGSSVVAAVLQGASTAYEATVGVNWTVNRNLRFQVGLTSLWATEFAAGRDGIVSGGNSDLSDRLVANRLVERENSMTIRCIFRL